MPASQSAGDPAAASAATASTASPTAANRANVPAEMRALGLTPATPVMSSSRLGPTAAPLVPTRRAAAAPAHRSSNATPARNGGGTTPHGPFGPSPNTAGTAAAAPSGGLSSGLWCDLFLILLAPIGQELRRRRVRAGPAGPVGVVSLLQRPG
jgi:hypothetical protein